MDAAAPIGNRKLRSPFTMSKSLTGGRILVLVIMVISVTYFSSEAPGFVSKLDFYNFLVTGIAVFFGFIGWSGVGKNVEGEISLGLGFMATMDYVGEILDAEVMEEFKFDCVSYGDSSICGNEELSDEWLGLPVRSLKFVVSEKRGDMISDNCFGLGCEDSCEVGDSEFGELSPMNLLEKFNEAAALIRVNVDSGIGLCVVS